MIFISANHYNYCVACLDRFSIVHFHKIVKIRYCFRHFVQSEAVKNSKLPVKYVSVPKFVPNILKSRPLLYLYNKGSRSVCTGENGRKPIHSFTAFSNSASSASLTARTAAASGLMAVRS